MIINLSIIKTWDILKRKSRRSGSQEYRSKNHTSFIVLVKNRSNVVTEDLNLRKNPSLCSSSFLLFFTSVLLTISRISFACRWFIILHAITFYTNARLRDKYIDEKCERYILSYIYFIPRTSIFFIYIKMMNNFR